MGRMRGISSKTKKGTKTRIDAKLRTTTVVGRKGSEGLRSASPKKGVGKRGGTRERRTRNGIYCSGRAIVGDTSRGASKRTGSARK